MKLREQAPVSMVTGITSRVHTQVADFFSRIASLLQRDLTPEEMEQRRSRDIVARLDSR